MSGYVYGQSPSAQLRTAHARIQYLESALTEARKHAAGRAPRDEYPAFTSPEFMALYDRERAIAARLHPETAEVKAARFEAIRQELATHKHTRVMKGQR